MPQLDFSIASSQIFWLVVTFFVLHTILTHYFLPNFIKVIKTRKQILVENNNKLANLKKQFDDKQNMFTSFIEKNLVNIKLLIEKEIHNIFQNILFLDCSKLDKKVSNALYYILIFYDINILKSVCIKT